MRKKVVQSLVLLVIVMLVLSACTSTKRADDSRSDTLTWGTWGNFGGHKAFLDLLAQTYPEIELEFISYEGANRTGYSWAQMRADDMPDIFITSQILDEELAKARLADLSEYPFTNQLSTAVLDQSEIDGGLYLVPVGYSMYGIFYNKTLMAEKGWALPNDFAELEALCEKIRAEGMIPGVIATQLTGGPFSAVFNLAKTDWLTTPAGLNWERDFLNGEATAQGTWEDTMAYVQRYIDIGMFTADPEDRDHDVLIEDYLGERKAMFCTAVHAIRRTTAKKTGGDELGMMPYISEDGSKNVYMYSPSCYFGLNKHLTEPGNEQKLADAVKILSLLFSPEGQAALVGDSSPTMMSVLDNAEVAEGSLIYDAKQAMRSGRAFLMTYAHWENVLSDMGQAYREWFRGEAGMNGSECIMAMDDIQRRYLNNKERLVFCQSTDDFTLAETGALVGQILGKYTEADAVLVPLGEFHDGVELKAGVNGKLYQGDINVEIANTICPAYDGEYAIMWMTGAQAKELAQVGLDVVGDGNTFPYILVTPQNEELADETSYRVAFLMRGYTAEMADQYAATVYQGSLRKFVRDGLAELETVAPGENYWSHALN